MRTFFAAILGGVCGCMAAGIAIAHQWPAWALFVAVVVGGIVGGTIVSMTAMMMERDG